MRKKELQAALEKALKEKEEAWRSFTQEREENYQLLQALEEAQKTTGFIAQEVKRMAKQSEKAVKERSLPELLDAAYDKVFDARSEGASPPEMAGLSAILSGIDLYRQGQRQNAAMQREDTE